MPNLSRRQFLQATAASAAGISLASMLPTRPLYAMTNKKPGIALQLWTVRNEIEKDLEGTLAKVKALGFDYVESAFFPEGISITRAAQALNSAGLKVCSIHCEMPTGAERDRWLELSEAYSCNTMIWHGWPETELYKTEDGVKQLAEGYNEANEYARSKGLRFGLHNHWWELTPHAGGTTKGRLPIDVLTQHISGDIFFEIDTYWVKVAGQNPSAIVSKYAARALYMHIKDGPAATPDDSMVALGTGTQDFPAILKASGGQAEWLVVEFDKCDSDIFAALDKSVKHLRSIL